MLKRLILPLVALLVSINLIPAVAQAHVLKSDGSVGAVLHIEPADDPVVGQPSSFYFEFKDKKGQFQPELCQCQVTIQENGKTVSEQQLDSTTSASFTFPERNAYQVMVSGMPNQAGDFQPFKLSYDIRVSRTADAAATKKDSFPKVLYGLLAVAAVGFMLLMLKYRKKHTTRSKNNKPKQDEEKVY